MFSMHGDPPTRRNKGIVARKVCQKPRMACVCFLGALTSPLERCITSNINSKVKAKKKVLATDLSTVLSWKSPCKSISARASDFSGS